MNFIEYYLEPIFNADNELVYYQWAMKFEEEVEDG